MAEKNIFYFDWAAASLVRPSVLSLLAGDVQHISFNPEAVHPAGRMAAEMIDSASERLSTALIGRKAPAVWAASGSDLLRLAAIAAGKYAPRKKAIVSSLEHPAVLATWQNFSGGCQICSPEEMPDHADADTGFATVSHIQSVLGRILPVEEITADIRRKAPESIIFVDTIQSAARYDLPAGGDFYSVSAAKLGSPAGGAAWIAATARAKKMLPVFRELRSRYYLTGRNDVFQAVLLATAAEEQKKERSTEYEKVSDLNRFVRVELDNITAPNGKIIRATIESREASPWILHLHFPGYQSAVLLRMLAKEGFCVSAGSACQAETDKPDPAMTEIGFSRADAFSGIRISFGFASNQRETEALVRKIKEILQSY